MDTILSYDGKVCYLSDTIYRIKLKDKEDRFIKDLDGALVRKISGVDDRSIVGYHFTPGYVTVHLIDRPMATFIGVRYDELEEINQ